MKLLITTQATADVPPSLFRDDLKIIPMGYTVNGEAYDGDKNALSAKEFYDVVSKAKTKEDLPQTAMVTAFTATEFFEKYLAEGYDIIHIGFDKALSGTYDQLCMAQKELQPKYPDRRLTVIESSSASFVEGMLAYEACLKKDAGATYDEIVDYIENIKLHSNGIFVIDNLMHLVRTGRASKAEGYIGSALQIKPVLHIDNEGKLVPFKKVMAKKKGLATLFETLKEGAVSPDEANLVAVGSADDQDSADFLAEKIKELGYKNVITLDVGPVIGTHVGKGMVAVFFISKLTRNEIVGKPV